MFPTRGFVPCSLQLANTKSSGLLYGVSACHTLSTSANAGCIGTVDFDACVLVPDPICPYVQEFLMRIEFWWCRTDFHLRASASEIRTPVAATISRSVYSGWTSKSRTAIVCSGFKMNASYSVSFDHRTNVTGLLALGGLWLWEMQTEARVPRTARACKRLNDFGRRKLS